MLIGFLVDKGDHSDRRHRSTELAAWLGQSYDHRVKLIFPEGEYFIGLVCRVVS
jgi:hypothetical protein